MPFTVQVNAAKKRGDEVETQKKFFAGVNRQHKGDKNTATLDAETEELHHERLAGSKIYTEHGPMFW